MVGPGKGALSPLFLDKTDARRAEQNFFFPLLPYLKVWSRHWSRNQKSRALRSSDSSVLMTV